MLAHAHAQWRRRARRAARSRAPQRCTSTGRRRSDSRGPRAATCSPLALRSSPSRHRSLAPTTMRSCRCARRWCGACGHRARLACRRGCTAPLCATQVTDSHVHAPRIWAQRTLSRLPPRPTLSWRRRLCRLRLRRPPRPARQSSPRSTTIRSPTPLSTRSLPAKAASSAGFSRASRRGALLAPPRRAAPRSKADAPSRRYSAAAPLSADARQRIVCEVRPDAPALLRQSLTRRCRSWPTLRARSRSPSLWARLRRFWVRPRLASVAPAQQAA